MTLRFAVVHEANADFTTATELADRVLVDAVDWLDEDQIPHQRSWLENEPSGTPLTWTGMKKLAREAGIRVHGHFEGEPGLPDAAAARRAIEYVRFAFSDLDAILLIRDQDDQPERRKGLEQARRLYKGKAPIVVGLAVVERECWVLSGFEPENQDETDRLEVERQTLGFDPRTRNHELTACKDERARRSPKRVLQTLSAENQDRQRRCWTVPQLAVLMERGAENGLADYLREIRTQLAPLIGHV